MALFWSKKPKAEKNYSEERKAVAGAPKSPRARGSAKAKAAPKAAAPKQAPAAVPAIPAGAQSAVSEAVLRPHITEKSGLLSQTGVYTFQVAKGATKGTVAKAVKALYKVTPVKVAIVNLPRKSVFVKGRYGSVAGVRKALVTVKKGDKIDFV